MENQGKIGILVMVMSVFLTIAFIVLSTDTCGVYSSTPLLWLEYCPQIQFFRSEDSSYIYLINIPFKYLLLVMIFTFCCGFLIKQNVIKIPTKSK